MQTECLSIAEHQDDQRPEKSAQHQNQSTVANLFQMGRKRRMARDHGLSLKTINKPF